MKRLCLILAYLFLFTQTASAMPLLIGQKVVYRGTITDLRISAVDGTALVDNLSGTLALANSPLLHTGTLTQANTRISAAATFAFIDTNDATFATNLAAHLGKYLVIKDSAGKKAYAWIKAAGTGETLGDETVSGFTNISYDVFTTSGADITNAEKTTLGVKSCYQNYSYLQTALYKSVISLSLVSGSAPLFGIGTANTFEGASKNAKLLSDGVNTNYHTSAPYHGACGFYNIADCQWNTSGISLKQVLTPSSSGATLSSTKNGTAMDNWESIETGFNYNDSSGYTYYIYGRDITDIADGNHSIEIYDSSNRMLKGVLKAAGTSATEGSDSARTFVAEIGTPTIAGDQITFSNALEGVIESDYWINGGLYLVDWSIASYAGSGNFYVYGGGFVTTGISKSANGNYASYVTSNSVNLRVVSTFGCSGIATINSIKQVLTPSSSGATITTLKNGDVYNWSYKNSSFSFNSASYYVIIKLIR